MAVHGHSTPPEIVRYGLSVDFDQCMTRALSAYRAIAHDLPREAQYVLPLAFRKRVLFTWNLREIHHFVQLRSGRQGHVSYRSIAQQVFRELERVLEYAFVFVKGAVITKDLLPELESPRPRPAATAHLHRQRWDSELLIIQKALHQARGNREAAARVLGISRSSLWRKMKAYDLL